LEPLELAFAFMSSGYFAGIFSRLLHLMFERHLFSWRCLRQEPGRAGIGFITWLRFNVALFSAVWHCGKQVFANIVIFELM